MKINDFDENSRKIRGNRTGYRARHTGTRERQRTASADGPRRADATPDRVVTGSAERACSYDSVSAGSHSDTPRLYNFSLYHFGSTNLFQTVLAAFYCIRACFKYCLVVRSPLSVLF